MDRNEQITRHITPEQRGIEIGPYWNPLAPKRRGYNCISIDVFTASHLRKQATADLGIPRDVIANIEEVDLIGSCTRIAELVAEKYPLGSFDYIISSHNLEHVPDPIRVLHQCQEVLKPGGILSMAVPDRRTCFDYFRPHSTLADWLEAYFEKRDRPTAKQAFRQASLHCRYLQNGQQLGCFPLDWDPAQIMPLDTLEYAFETYKAFEANPDEVYRDNHCWAFTPASLELILRDLRFLGLLQLNIQQVTATYGNEFYVRLQKVDAASEPPISRQEFYEMRRKLLHRTNDEASENSLRVFQMRRHSTSS